MVPASSKGVLMIPYGDSIRLELKGNDFTLLKPYFLGLATQSYQLTVAGERMMCFSIEFTDIGFYALFQENALLFANTPILAEEVIASPHMQSLQTQLAEANGPMKKINIAECFLLQFLPDRKCLYRIERVATALSLIRKHKGFINIHHLAEDVCMSDRQFRRIFQEVKGCSPKRFTGLIRFAHVFTEVMQTQGNVHWAGLAYKYKYYDQMHLIKDFKEYTLFTPSRFPLQQFNFSSALTIPLVPSIPQTL
jgi:AraC-like DNA-binding protein